MATIESAQDGGASLFDLMEMFPDEAAAREWFEEGRWKDGRHCPRCGSFETYECRHAKMPYRCTDCGAYFSVKTGTALEGSKISLRKWLFAIYLEATSHKGIASTKLSEQIGVTQKTAWFMLHRIRETWAKSSGFFSGPAEVDETYFGGLEKNKHGDKKLRLGRGGVGKTIVAGARDRATKRVCAEVVPAADSDTLQQFIANHVEPTATVYTDEASAYKGMPFRHKAVRHGAGQYVDGEVSTNGIESFWAVLKRAHKGVYHKISPKHLQRYLYQFTGKHNAKDLGTLELMRDMVVGMIGRRLTYPRLIADNGLPSGARS